MKGTQEQAPNQSKTDQSHKRNQGPDVTGAMKNKNRVASGQSSKSGSNKKTGNKGKNK